MRTAVTIGFSEAESKRLERWPRPRSVAARLLSDILCLQEERTFGNDNFVSYHGKRLQIPPRTHRCHYGRAKV